MATLTNKQRFILNTLLSLVTILLGVGLLVAFINMPINQGTCELFGVCPCIAYFMRYVLFCSDSHVIVAKFPDMFDVCMQNGGYVCLVGLVVSGEWNLPDNCREIGRAHV